MANVSRKHGAKKKAQSQGYDKVQGTLDSVLNHISKGAKIEKREHGYFSSAKTEYWLVFKEGGAYKISRKIYDKIVR
jgi:hypothetical protein